MVRYNCKWHTDSRTKIASRIIAKKQKVKDDHVKDLLKTIMGKIVYGPYFVDVNAL